MVPASIKRTLGFLLAKLTNGLERFSSARAESTDPLTKIDYLDRFNLIILDSNTERAHSIGHSLNIKRHIRVALTEAQALEMVKEDPPSFFMVSLEKVEIDTSALIASLREICGLSTVFVALGRPPDECSLAEFDFQVTDPAALDQWNGALREARYKGPTPWGRP